jgi:hypothetical protein
LRHGRLNSAVAKSERCGNQAAAGEAVLATQQIINTIAKKSRKPVDPP